MLRKFVGALIGAYVAGTVLLGHANAASPPPACMEAAKGIDLISKQATATKSKVLPITPDKMPIFIANMKMSGVVITGDAAIIMETPDGSTALFTIANGQICLAKMEVVHPPAKEKPLKPYPGNFEI